MSKSNQELVIALLFQMLGFQLLGAHSSTIGALFLVMGIMGAIVSFVSRFTEKEK